MGWGGVGALGLNGAATPATTAASNCTEDIVTVEAVVVVVLVLPAEAAVVVLVLAVMVVVGSAGWCAMCRISIGCILLPSLYSEICRLVINVWEYCRDLYC